MTAAQYFAAADVTDLITKHTAQALARLEALHADGEAHPVSTYELESGDRYVGELVRVQGNLVTLANYSVWYEDEPAPVESAYADDTIQFTITEKARVTA